MLRLSWLPYLDQNYLVMVRSCQAPSDFSTVLWLVGWNIKFLPWQHKVQSCCNTFLVFLTQKRTPSTVPNYPRLCLLFLTDGQLLLSSITLTLSNDILFEFLLSHPLSPPRILSSLKGLASLLPQPTCLSFFLRNHFPFSIKKNSNIWYYFSMDINSSNWINRWH